MLPFHWPAQQGAVPLTDAGWCNTLYLSQSSPHCDPSIVWGTTVDMEPLESFLAAERHKGGVILSIPHVLLACVAKGLREHPRLNRRIIGRRVYRYKDINLAMPMLRTRTGEVDILFIPKADERSLDSLARQMWSEARDRAVQAATEQREAQRAPSWNRTLKTWWDTIRLQWVHKMSWYAFWHFNSLRAPTTHEWHREMNGANAIVNYLGFPGAPPMQSYKPSQLPMNSLSVSVTMGATEPRAVVVDGQVVVRRQAPLFVRVDHRMVNGHQTAEFVQCLRTHLANPAALLRDESSTSPATVKRAA